LSDVGDGAQSTAMEAKLKKVDEGPGFTLIGMVVALTTVLMMRYFRRLEIDDRR